jgi:hypothetical protein
MRIVFAFVLATLCLPAFADTPEEAITKYIEAVVDGEFDDVGRLFHPVAVKDFRRDVEPLIQKAVRGRSGRQMFGGFIDPYNPKTLKSMTDDEFVSAFARWMKTWREDTLSMLTKTEFTVLGHVSDGDSNHVVVRLNADYNGTPWETIIIRSTREYEGKQLLLIPTELANAAATLQSLR